MIKTTLRYLWRNKLFTALNIVGLSIGISACWMVFGIVHYEFSFDKKIPELKHVYQIISGDSVDPKNKFPGIPLGMAQLMTEESLDEALIIPVYSQHFERLFIPQEDEAAQLILDEQRGIIGTLPSYFELLPYEWIAGNAATAFQDPHSMVLTEKRARVYFPSIPPTEMIGRVIMTDTTQMVVSGIVKELTEYENIETPLLYKGFGSSERKAIVGDLLDRFAIVGKKDLFPHQLSGGQQQIVGIARALAVSPKLLLADEPTGNLNSKQGEEIMELFQQLNQEGTTIVQVTHSDKNATYGKRVIHLLDGQLQP